MSDLANVLSDIADTADQIRDILSDAGILSNQVALDGSPFQMWRQALEAAEGQSAMPSVLSVMRGRYPKNNKLFDAELRYWTEKQLQPATPPPSAGDSRTLWDITNQMSVMHIRLMYIERQVQSLAVVVAKMEERRELDWVRASILISVSAGLASFLTVLLSRLI